MKKRIVVLCCFFLAASLIAGALPAGAQDFDFMGDFCWSEPDGGTIKLGVSQVGTGHLQINGAIYNQNGTLDSVLAGSGEIAADGIHMALTMSATGDTFVSGIFHLTLSKKNLNGTGDSILHYYDKVPQTLDTIYDSRAVTRIPCP